MPDSAVKVDEAQVCGRDNMRVPALQTYPLNFVIQHL